jgi:hypothetical protein
MAEILVSDLCERRPPLLIGGHFGLGPCDGNCSADSGRSQSPAWMERLFFRL